MLVATSLSGHEILTMAAIVAAVFLAFQANVAVYGTMVFWITVILGLMFGMLGFFAPELLVLRLKETAVGAACGGAVASLVLVRQERAPVEDATFAPSFRRWDIRWTVPPVRCSTARQPPDLATRILAAEQRFRDLSAIAQAERLGLAGSTR